MSKPQINILEKMSFSYMERSPVFSQGCHLGSCKHTLISFLSHRTVFFFSFTGIDGNRRYFHAHFQLTRREDKCVSKASQQDGFVGDMARLKARPLSQFNGRRLLFLFIYPRRRFWVVVHICNSPHLSLQRNPKCLAWLTIALYQQKAVRR